MERIRHIERKEGTIIKESLKNKQGLLFSFSWWEPGSDKWFYDDFKVESYGNASTAAAAAIVEGLNDGENT